MKLDKQRVYLPIPENSVYKILEDGICLENCYPEEGYFFTSEQLNEYTKNIIKESLKTAAEKARCCEDAIVDLGHTIVEADVDKKSILNQFKSIFEKFKHE